MNPQQTALLRKERATLIFNNECSLSKAVASGNLNQFVDISLNEALVLGLLNQGVTKYIGIFGHGSTDLGEVLRVYEESGLIKTYNVRNEVEASHVAAALRWQYGETAAVFTSIGPGALQALAASLMPLSNGLGVYYIFGDETTHAEGPNMQQIPGNEQELFLKLTSSMGKSYTLHTPEAIFTALKRGMDAVFNHEQAHPFYILLPMNTQAKMMKDCNILEFPSKTNTIKQIPSDKESFDKALELLLKYEKITVKVGNGAKDIPQELFTEFIELIDAAYVHGPIIQGLVDASHPQNMTVGGSKGSISGNFAMENCELLIVIGARAVCQWDSSGTSWKNVKEIININTRSEDALHFNRTLPLLGDAAEIVSVLVNILRANNINKGSSNSDWSQQYKAKRKEWLAFKKLRYTHTVLFDEKWNKELLTQPAAIKTVIDFADEIQAVKYFDAGDVQANGFQIIEDKKMDMTFTDNGASYMGFAVSGILASAIAEKPVYPIAFTGDGCFMMNPQILIDAVQFGLYGMIVLFDNRCMAAIAGLQKAQYGKAYKTDDNIKVDYVQMATSVEGVKGFFGGYSTESLRDALKNAYQHKGLSLVHVPVYYGNDELGGMGVFGNWNVGNWCDDVQKEKHRLGF